MARDDSHAEAAGRFETIARTYCSLVDSAPGLDKTDLLARLYNALPTLIDAAIQLPQLPQLDEKDDGEEAERVSLLRATTLSNDAWQKLYQSLKEKFGDSDLYWCVFDAMKDSEAIHGSLADDIADIYLDLIKGLVLMEKSAPSPKNAIWEWRFGFDSHWGDHAMSALKCIHDIRNC